MMDREDLSELMLRIGLAFAFLFPPLNALSDPDAWIGYFPHFLRSVAPDAVLLYGFGAVEVMIALWLLSGWRIFWPAAIAALTLFAIVSFNPSGFQVLFRDLSIAAMAFALAIREWPRAGAASAAR